MEAGGGHLEVVHAHPQIIDLDGDSLKDLVCGNENGYVYFFKNHGTNEVPHFETAHETLMTVDSVFIDGYTNSRLHICDWTGDGDLDIILGGQDGHVWLCENAAISSINEYHNPAVSSSLFQLIHNPVKYQAQFQYSCFQYTRAHLALYSVTGRRIDAFDLGHVSPGTHSFTWNVPDLLCTGIYIAVFSVDGSCCTEKLVVIK
jgi:hypothetical protein